MITVLDRPVHELRKVLQQLRIGVSHLVCNPKDKADLLQLIDGALAGGVDPRTYVQRFPTDRFK